MGVVFAFSPPDVEVLEVVDVLAVEALELELELDSLDPQPTANSSAEQAIATAGRPLLIGTILSRGSASEPNERHSRPDQSLFWPLAKAPPEDCA